MIDGSLGANVLWFAVLVALVLVGALFYGRALGDRRLAKLLFLAVGTRALGAVAMFITVVYTYGGGDALGYLEAGNIFADALRNSEYDFYFSSVNWWAERWWGSQFIVFVCSGTAIVFGDLMLPQFFLFSLLPFAGVWFLVLTFRKKYPHGEWFKFGCLVLLLPSVWFWSSSIGKEAVILLGVGLAFGGFARLPRARSLFWMCLGLSLIFAIRPQVAAVVSAALAAAYLLAEWRNLTPGGITVVTTLAAGAVFIAVQGAGALGLQSAGLQGASGYIEDAIGRADAGTTAVVAPGIGAAALPVALANVLFRPLPWEIRNVTSALASLEIMAIWGVVALRAKQTFRRVHSLSGSTVFVGCVILVCAYATLLGMTVVNLGIISRQRSFILPLLVMAVFVPGAVRSRARRRGARRDGISETTVAPLPPKGE